MGTGGDQTGLTEQMRVKQRSEGDERASHLEKSFSGIVKSKCKGPEVGTSFAMFGDNKEASVAGGGWKSSKVVRNEVGEEREAGKTVTALVKMLESLRGRQEAMGGF